MSTTPLHVPAVAREESPAILVVDDDQGCLNLTRLMLNDDNYECLCAFDIETAWNILQEHAISVVISDLHLDALGLIARMRAQPRFSTIPVIVATGDDRDEIVRAVMASGAASFLSKPYLEDDLLPLVRQCLTGKQA